MGGFLFYAATVGFAVGIAARSVISLELPDIAFLLLLALVLAIVGRRGSCASAAPYVIAAALFLSLFALGALRLSVAEWSVGQSPLQSQLGEEITISGTVIQEPDERARTTHLYVDIGADTLLVLTDPFESWQYGDVVTVTGTLEEPESFETDLGRTFDYPGYLLARDVEYTVPFADVRKIGDGGGNLVIAGLLAFKAKLITSIDALLPEPQAGLSAGLLLGVKRALGEDLEETFRTTGIIHIVVLSGYNVMLVVAFVTYVLAFLVPLRFRLWLGLVAIAAFALTVGLSATVVRASLMASLVLIARATNRTYLVLRALMLTGAVMLLVNPHLLLFDTGFQLSFLATLGLILVAPHLEERMALVPSTIGVREFLTATVATQFFITPFLLYQIGEFSVVAVAVNVLVLPMVPVAMLLTFVAALLHMALPTVAMALAYPAYLSLSYIIAIAEWFGSLPFAAYVVPPFPFFVVVVAYAIIGWILWKLMRHSGIPGETALESTARWTIVEETNSDERTASSTTASTKTETPIFFR